MARKFFNLYSNFSICCNSKIISNFILMIILWKFFKKIYEEYFFENKKKINTKKHAFICGSVSGIIASTIVYPLEMMRFF